MRCAQCGREFSSGGVGGEVGKPICSQGCLHAYKQQTGYVHPVDAVLGLAGKAIGGAVSGAKARRQEQAQQEAYEQEQRRAEREERDRQDAEEEAAASAARHVITHEVVCPICDADVIAKMASDGETKVRCKQCKTRLKVEHDGDVTVLGPKDKKLSGAESMDIKEDRLCSQCKHFVKEGLKWKKWLALMGIVLVGAAIGWFSGGILMKIGMVVVTILAAIIGAFSLMVVFDECGNKDAVSASGMESPSNVNANLRCKFWEKK
jgi:hypothetical protein